MKPLLLLPILIPLATAAVLVLAWRWYRLHRWIGVLGPAGLLAASVALLLAVSQQGIQVVQLGNWPAPLGITFVADLFSAIMVFMAALVGFSVAVYSLGSMDVQRESYGYYPLLNILLMGVCGAFLTGDIFNLFVWFEVMLMASFVLLALGGERAQLEGAIKYVTLNMVSSALFLAAVGILYGLVGTLNMADLAVKLHSPETSPALLRPLAMLFLVAFGIKAAVFPLFFWLPASYHTPPVAVSALFAGLLTKVGVYALIRTFTLLFTHDAGFTHGLILVIAGLTMVTGVLGAAAQHEFRRILSFHIVSQIGYMIMGLGLAGMALAAPQQAVFALAAGVFYIVHHIIVKTNLFLVSGLVHRLRGSFELHELGGLFQSHPGTAILFLIPACSLAGIPPLSGFFAKLSLLQAGLSLGQYTIVAVALAVGLWTLFSMSKIWMEVFWKPCPQPQDAALPSWVHTPQSPVWLWLPVVVLAAITVLIGLAAGPLFDLSLRTAEQLLNREAYIHAVTGGVW